MAVLEHYRNMPGRVQLCRLFFATELAKFLDETSFENTFCEKNGVLPK